MGIKAHVEELKEMKKYSPSIYIRMQRKRPSHFLKNVEKSLFVVSVIVSV